MLDALLFEAWKPNKILTNAHRIEPALCSELAGVRRYSKKKGGVNKELVNGSGRRESWSSADHNADGIASSRD
jgi:hypothetical protein